MYQKLSAETIQILIKGSRMDINWPSQLPESFLVILLGWLAKPDTYFTRFSGETFLPKDSCTLTIGHERDERNWPASSFMR